MLEQLYEFRYLLIAILFLLIAIIIMITLKNRKVEPIDMEEVLDEDTEKTKIEEVIEAMENSASERPMTTFEQEQEANAIISYEELVKAVEAKKNGVEFKKVDDEKFKIEDILGNIEEPQEEIIEEETIENVLEEIEEIEDLKEDASEEAALEEKPKFKNSEFISPVFGKDEKTNDDFLDELKDLRKNL